ncbi:hypothetical protein Tco_0805011, partial [Tanacetum coccineum]
MDNNGETIQVKSVECSVGSIADAERISSVELSSADIIGYDLMPSGVSLTSSLVCSDAVSKDGDAVSRH